MNILSAIEYKKSAGHYSIYYSITALDFDKVTWSGVSIVDWNLYRYSDLFYLWNRDDMSDFTEFNLDLLSFKAPDWNPCCRRYQWAAIKEVIEWAAASRVWFYTNHFDFNTISNWRIVNECAD
jgi:hypothetical protein